MTTGKKVKSCDNIGILFVFRGEQLCKADLIPLMDTLRKSGDLWVMINTNISVSENIKCHTR